MQGRLRPPGKTHQGRAVHCDITVVGQHGVGHDNSICVPAPAAFPLRLRRLVRELADREHLSQNEFIAIAVDHELVVRGALVADEIASTSRRLGKLTGQQMGAVVDRSIGAFVEGEGGARSAAVKRAPHRCADDSQASG